jgi:tripartite-type tricarboxylate transporter receptor subunit TctC
MSSDYALDWNQLARRKPDAGRVLVHVPMTGDEEAMQALLNRLAAAITSADHTSMRQAKRLIRKLAQI